METRVGIGALAVSDKAHDSLVAVGLGSCVAVVVLGRKVSGRALAGLAHVLLPRPGSDMHPDSHAPAKYADAAVDTLAQTLVDTGAVPNSLRAVLVGGARMFGFVAAPEIGSRNVAVAEQQLRRLNIPIVATATGGDRGRTVRVSVGQASVVVRDSGGVEHDLLAGRRASVADSDKEN